MKKDVSSIVDLVITNRRSIRAFKPDPVPRREIQRILSVARRAPSGTNHQPWRVYVLEGKAREDLVHKVCQAYDSVFADSAQAQHYHEEYAYYPKKWFDPYLARRRENGYGLYALLGIQKGDKGGMHLQHQKNFKFFNAPVGLIFTLHRDLGQGSLIDYGMFLQSIMIAAQARGIDTCPQAAWNRFSKIVLPHVGASEDEMLVCGMAMGYADYEDEVNAFCTSRVEQDEFTTWVG